MAKRNQLICHIMQDMVNEVGTAKAKLYAQEFQWKKRMWPISKDAIAWKDRKGINHMFFDVNESDGTIRFLAPTKQVEQRLPDGKFIDKCIECGGAITIDARNTWDLLKRKTVDVLFGIDQSHIVLLMIIGIVALICIAAVFFLIGENKKLQDIITTYIKGQAVTAKFILGVNHIGIS